MRNKLAESILDIRNKLDTSYIDVSNTMMASQNVKPSKMSRNYVQKIRDELPEKEERLKDLLRQKENLDYEIALSKPFGLPCDMDGYRQGTPYITCKKYIWYGYDYKGELHQKWVDPIQNKHCLTKEAAAIIYYIVLAIFFITLAYSSIVSDIPKILNIQPVLFTIGSYAMFEFVIGIISVWYFLVRPNSINKKISKKNRSAILSKIRILENEIQMDKNTITQFDIVMQDPNEKFASMKGDTYEKYSEILNHSLTEILEKIEIVSVKAKYERVLKRCQDLLEMGKSYGQVLTDCSRLFNMYILEINDVILKSDEDQANELHMMLDNLMRYVEKKIKKYDEITDIMANKDISAINSALLEEMEEE